MLLFSTLLALSIQSTSAEASVAEPPRLVVVIGVDQMIPEQLERLAPHFGGGFGRFVRQGHTYRNAMLEHANTETGPGYATLGTGCHPRTSGVISNDWFNADGSDYVYCVEDRDAFHVVGSGLPASTSAGVSPKNLRVPGLGDWLKASSPESLVVSLAGKDRAAVGMGGRKPDLCLWWNRTVSGFTTTTWYRDQLPEWVETFNSGLTSYIFDGPWGDGWALELPTDIEKAGTAADERAGEASRAYVDGLLATGRGEPDPLKRRGLLGSAAYRSPIGDQLTLELAQLSVAKYDLGGDEHPDLLFLGLSGCDVVGTLALAI